MSAASPTTPPIPAEQDTVVAGTSEPWIMPNAAEHPSGGDDGRLPPCPIPWKRPIAFLVWSFQLLFGLASLTFLLSVIAAIPVVNLYSLGFLLEVEGRVARSGRLRDAFPLIRVAPRVGSIALGVYLWTLVLRLIGNSSSNAYIVDPGGAADGRLAAISSIAWGVITVHLCLALARGGGLMTFVRPIKNVRWLMARWRAGDYLETASNHVSSFVSELQLQHHFSLGLRGFAVGMLWLIVPSVLYVSAREPKGGQRCSRSSSGFC